MKTRTVTSTNPIKDTRTVHIPSKDLYRLVTNIAYDTVELVAHRVRKMRIYEKMDAQTSLDERTTLEWMQSAVDMALREIETSYPDVGILTRKSMEDFELWKKKK